MAIECVILDFDGTFTDVEAEAAPYVDAFQAAMRELFGPEIDTLWQEAEAEIRRAPNEHGWLHEGRIVAPALADPYIRCTVSAQLIFKRLGRMQEPKFRAALLQTLYGHSYGFTLERFRPHAAEVIERVLSLRPGKVFVVTNSATETVRKKLDGLIPGLSERLRVEGNARKFMLDELQPSEPGFAEFQQVPAEKRLKALPERAVLLRRGHYFRILQKIWRDTGASPASTLVCGDIFELDLALPASLGATVHLMTREGTHDYEIEGARERGEAGDDLRALLSHVV